MEFIVTQRVYFLSILVKCGLIRRELYSGEMTMIISNDRWTLFKSEYKLDIEIIKLKVDVLVENNFIRRCVNIGF